MRGVRWALRGESMVVPPVWVEGQLVVALRGLACSLFIEESADIMKMSLVLPFGVEEFAPNSIKLLLNSFSLVPLLVGICAEMNETFFELIQTYFFAGRDFRQDG